MRTRLEGLIVHLDHKTQKTIYILATQKNLHHIAMDYIDNLEKQTGREINEEEAQELIQILESK